MPKYIELEQAIDLFYPEDPENDGSDGCTTVLKSGNYTSAEIESMLSNLPAADVVPVIHGKWKHDENVFDDEWSCSSCHEAWTFIDGTTPEENNAKYCPNCGAKMDLEDDE